MSAGVAYKPYYPKREAAEILGVSVTQLGLILRDNRLIFSFTDMSLRGDVTPWKCRGRSNWGLSGDQLRRIIEHRARVAKEPQAKMVAVPIGPNISGPMQISMEPTRRKKR